MITPIGYNNCKIPFIIIISSLVLFIFQINNDLDLNSKYFEYIYAIENIDETNDDEIDFDYIFDHGEYFEEDNAFLNKNNNNNKNNETGQLSDNSNYTRKEISDNKIDNQQSKTVSNLSSDFNFVAVGDWDCKSETEDTVENIIDKSPELVLALGDLSYDSSAKCWFKIIEPIADRTKIAMGNHESESSKKLKDYKEFFGLEKQYYSFNYENVHFLVLSTEIPYDEDSEQYKFVINDLEKSFKDSSIDWIVTFYHKQTYSSGGGPDDEEDFREIYHPLFDKFNVDLALQGHVHAYERLYPITFNEDDDDDEPIVQDNNTNTYRNSKGTIFVTVGTGGANEHDLSKKKDFSAVAIDGKFGILNIEVNNNNNNTANDTNNTTKTLTGRFIENEDDDEFKTLDEFMIIKN